MKHKILHVILPAEGSGIKVIELANWSGKVFVVPRTHLKDLKNRPESTQPALYFLFGENDESTNQKLYIGESENFLDRLFNHDANKDFWNKAVIFTGSLDKAKARYLEYLATSEARQVGRYSLLNAASRKENSLSEYDEVATRDYFENVKFLLAALEYPVFDHVEESVTDKRIYILKGEGFDARGQILEDGSVVVLKDSLARIRETDSFGGWSLSARKEFLEQGLLGKHNEESYIFAADVDRKSVV